MIIRKNKIKLIQFFLLFVAISLILFTYSKLRITSSEKILSKETKAVIDEKLKNRDESGDTFFNVKYSGIMYWIITLAVLIKKSLCSQP